MELSLKSIYMQYEELKNGYYEIHWNHNWFSENRV